MSDIPETYGYLGWYAPAEARKLLEALEHAGIPVHAEFHDGLRNLSAVDAAYGGGFGGTASVLIAVESARRPDVDTIHATIFGTGLPAVVSDGSEDRILITRHGRPAGILIGFADEDDYFEYQLENDPRFEARIERARRQKRDGKVTRLEDIKP